MASWAHLSIGTADDRINLVGRKGAYWVHDWKPTAGPVEDYFSESALADGRQLASYRDLNATESFPLTVRASSQDGAIEATQDLRRMLRKARDYWASAHQPDPVYLAAQASCETYMRYAIVHAGAFPQDAFPFAGTFTRKNPAMTELPFVVERGPWLENAPGTGTLISASAVESFDGRNLGTVDSSGVREATSAGVYVANKRNVANLTHVFTWSAANGFSANLMDAALPFNLLDDVGAAPQAGDYICFGIETGAGSVELTDAGRFFSLVFDVGTAGAGYTGLWQYPATVGSVVAWSQFYVADNTEQDGAGGGETWDTLGVRSVHWQRLVSWERTDVNGVTAYWVRYILTQVPGPFTTPVQQNRDVYSIVWPYIDIAANQVGGDMPSLLRLHVHNVSSAEPGQSQWSLPYYPDDMAFDTLVAGLRSYDRGADFTAYINLSDEQNPAGITITDESADLTMVDAEDTPTGRCWQHAPAGDVEMCRIGTIDLDSTISEDFYGAYHAYLRVKQVGGSAGDVSARLGLDHADTLLVLCGFGSGLNSYRYSQEAATQTTAVWELLDMGYITIPGNGLETEILDHFYIRVYVTNSNAPTADLFLSDLILIPVDEWAIRVEESKKVGFSKCVTYETYLDVDGITAPRRVVQTPVRLVSNDNVTFLYLPQPNNRPRLQHGLRQRLWFLTSNSRYAGATSVARCEAAQKIELWRVQRYASMRGSR